MPTYEFDVEVESVSLYSVSTHIGYRLAEGQTFRQLATPGHVDVKPGDKMRVTVEITPKESA